MQINNFWHAFAKVINDWNEIKNISPELQDELLIINVAFNQNTSALQYASYRIRSSPHIMFKFIQKDSSAYKYVSGPLRDNVYLAKFVCYLDISSIKYCAHLLDILDDY